MKRMKLALALTLSASMTSSMAVLPAYAEEAAVPTIYKIGDTMEDFTATLSDGTEVSLSGLLEDHDMVLINFWATWCGPCRAEFPFMQEAYDAYSDQVAIVALSTEPTDSDDVIEAFKEENGLTTLPMGQDATGVSDNFYFEGIPTSVVVDRYGVICWMETGTITSVDKFERLFNGFIGDDYTESKVGFVVPGPMPSVDRADVEDLKAALNVTDDNIVIENPEDEQVWPFVPSADGSSVVSTNAYNDETDAQLLVTVTAQSGDALTFNYSVEAETAYDYLVVYVDDEYCNVFNTGEGTYAIPFEDDGTYTVTFAYEKDLMGGEGEDQAVLSDLALLSGDEAAAAVEANPQYPTSLEGDAYEVEVLNGQEIVILDETGAYEENMGRFKSYLADGDTATFRIKLGSDYHANTAFLVGDWDQMPNLLSEAEIEDDSYVVTIDLSTVEQGGYSNTYVNVYPDFVNSPTESVMIIVYASEENVNYFTNIEWGSPIAWQYADGTLPSTDAIAEEPQDFEIPEGSAEYTIVVVDQDGEPVVGAMTQVCDEETCEVYPTDDEGIVTVVKEQYPYEIHMLMLPEGYSFDTTQIFTMEAEGGELVITVNKD